jgi:hypothetical protein
LGENGEGFDAGLVVGDPVDQGVAVAAEFVGSHVEASLVGHGAPEFVLQKNGVELSMQLSVVRKLQIA